VVKHRQIGDRPRTRHAPTQGNKVWNRRGEVPSLATRSEAAPPATAALR
jgi:hypothetical protein